MKKQTEYEDCNSCPIFASGEPCPKKCLKKHNDIKRKKAEK